MSAATGTPRFNGWIQGRVARIAIGASTARNQGGPGVVSAARKHLAVIDLSPFGTGDASRFARALDAATVRMRSALPEPSRTWGLARKFVNIFLRDCLYTCYLRDRYGLGRAEAFFEIPLDSISGTRIRSHRLGHDLSRWPGVKYMSSKLSNAYQEVGSAIARSQRIERVHLDAYWWGVRD